MIGNRIKRIREYRSYSQEFMASELQISQSAYSDLENNKTKLNLERMTKIAEILDIDIIKLLTKSFTLEELQQSNITNTTNLFIQLSNQLKTQYEKRLKEKDDIIAILKAQIANK